MTAPEHPTWTNYIARLLSAPYWIEPPEKSEEVGAGWIAAMKLHNVDLSSYASVKAYAMTTYYHLTPPSMPLSISQTESWPQPALATYRLWVTEGMRETDNDPLVSRDTIPISLRHLEAETRLRRDILSLTEAELNDYRARLDKVLDGEDWKKLCSVHPGCPCPEGVSFPWHRAHILALESLIDFPIPYWNFFASASSTPGDASAGIPRAFLDDEYTHPEDGLRRPNPLKCPRVEGGAPVRNPLLVDPSAETEEQRSQKIMETEPFLRQISSALARAPSSHSEFDSLLAHPHASYHAWVWVSAAVSVYDPIHWSLHVNMDRIFETWIESNINAATPNQLPLMPFIGRGRDIEIDTAATVPSWIYTTVGDVARNSRALGYTYEMPMHSDRTMDASLLRVSTGADEQDKIPYVGELTRGMPMGV